MPPPILDVTTDLDTEIEFGSVTGSFPADLVFTYYGIGAFITDALKGQVMLMNECCS